jgi:hypothetical protein
VATALNDTHMEESVARAISQRDEAKAFVRVVPFDDGSDGWAGRTVELRAGWRRISEIAGRRLVVVVGEITAAARAKISVSVAHVRCSKQEALAFGKVASEAKSFLLVPKDEFAQ